MTVFDKINLVFLWSSDNASTYFWGVWKETHRGSSVAKINNIHFHAWETEILANNRNMLIGGWRNTCLCLVQYAIVTAEEQFSLVKLLRLALSHLVSLSAKSSNGRLCKSALPEGLSISNIQISKTILLLSFMNRYLCSIFSVLLFASFFISFLPCNISLVPAGPNIPLHVMQSQIHAFNLWRVSYVISLFIWIFVFCVKHEISLTGGLGRVGISQFCLHLVCYIGVKSHEQGSVRLPQVQIKYDCMEKPSLLWIS